MAGPGQQPQYGNGVYGGGNGYGPPGMGAKGGGGPSWGQGFGQAFPGVQPQYGQPNGMGMAQGKGGQQYNPVQDRQWAQQNPNGNIMDLKGGSGGMTGGGTPVAPAAPPPSPWGTNGAGAVDLWKQMQAAAPGSQAGLIAQSIGGDNGAAWRAAMNQAGYTLGPQSASGAFGYSHAGQLQTPNIAGIGGAPGGRPFTMA